MDRYSGIYPLINFLLIKRALKIEIGSGFLRTFARFCYALKLFKL